MKKFKVRLKGSLLRTIKIVQAKTFEVNTFANYITFKDDKGDNVALFHRFDVEYIEYLEGVTKTPRVIL